MLKIDVREVSLGYGRKPVLKDLSFRVKPGEMVGLIGPNGCGKSTIIRALSRIISPYTGKILIDGKDITRIPRQALARLIGVVPQMPLLPSAFTAFEVVLMGRNPHLGLLQYEGPRDHKIALAAMGKTGTQSLTARRVRELSGGEIQCLLIARALTQETKAILLDEPTANLDIGHQIEILNMIKDLCQRENLTVLAALHDLNLAAQYCDRLLLINNGGIQAEGRPGEVITARNVQGVYRAAGCVFSHPTNNLPCVLISAGDNTTQAGDTENIDEMDKG
jgi:iron complex transport system ATP-binding protein